MMSNINFGGLEELRRMTDPELEDARHRLVDDFARFFPVIAEGLGVKLADEDLSKHADIPSENPFGIRPFGGVYELDKKGNVTSFETNQRPKNILEDVTSLNEVA